MAGESLSPGDLLCQEDFRAELAVADEDDTCIDISRAYAGDPDTEEEYLALLANQEPHRGFNANDTLVIDSWFRNARLEAITWILRVGVSFFIPFFFHFKLLLTLSCSDSLFWWNIFLMQTRKTFGFHFHTAYLSMIYFDRFISSRSIDVRLLNRSCHLNIRFFLYLWFVYGFLVLQRRHSWVVKLISVACISLASKMEEVQVPSLPEFQTDGVIFESKSVQRVELGILSTLQWRMDYATPFAFIRHFIMKFSRQDSPPRETISRTVRYILALMKGT